MAILSEHKRRKRTVATADGNHIPVSEWTHADSVELSNGLTLDDSKVELTQEEYDSLGDEKLTNNVEYWITDASGSSEILGNAINIGYDNTESGMDATNLQDAVTELNEALANGTVKFRVVDGELEYSVYTEEV